jgi:hypothetical protein
MIMKRVVKVVLAAVAVVSLAVPAMAADKLIIKNAAGTADVFKVDDTGTMIAPSAAWPTSGVTFKNAANIQDFSSMAAVPDGSIANQGVALQVIPKGNGWNYFGLTIRSQFSVFNTDLNADATNYEALVLKAAGAVYAIGSVQNGTGVVRPITFQTANLNRFMIAASGNIGVGAFTDLAPPTHLFEVAAGTIAISPATTTTAPAAGGAGALPATPAGYMTITIGGVDRKVAYY